MPLLHPTLQELEILVDDGVLLGWKHNQLAQVEALLTCSTVGSQNPGHHVLASRALVRTRLRQWDAAILDAEQVFSALLSHAQPLTCFNLKSIKSQPSVIGYIAHFVALVGKGKVRAGYRVCDIAIERFHLTHVTVLLLIKVRIPCHGLGRLSVLCLV